MFFIEIHIFFLRWKQKELKKTTKQNKHWNSQKNTPGVGIEPATPGSEVRCSFLWANRAYQTNRQFTFFWKEMKIFLILQQLFFGFLLLLHSRFSECSKVLTKFLEMLGGAMHRHHRSGTPRTRWFSLSTALPRIACFILVVTLFWLYTSLSKLGDTPVITPTGPTYKPREVTFLCTHILTVYLSWIPALQHSPPLRFFFVARKNQCVGCNGLF